MLHVTDGHHRRTCIVEDTKSLIDDEGVSVWGGLKVLIRIYEALHDVEARFVGAKFAGIGKRTFLSQRGTKYYRLEEFQLVGEKFKLLQRVRVLCYIDRDTGQMFEAGRGRKGRILPCNIRHMDYLGNIWRAGLSTQNGWYPAERMVFHEYGDVIKDLLLLGHYDTAIEQIFVEYAKVLRSETLGNENAKPA